MTDEPTSVEVAIPLPLHQTFTYLIPTELKRVLLPGCRVKVPFGPRTLVGIVTGYGATTEGLKSIKSVIDAEPIIPRDMLVVAGKMARHYFCGIGEALGSFLPAAVKRGVRPRTVTLLRANEESAREALPKLESSPRTARQYQVLSHVMQHPEGLTRGAIMESVNCSPSPVQSLLKQNLLTLSEERVPPATARVIAERTVAPDFTPEQRRATVSIRDALDTKTYRGFLLFGVTGSGKTEVYLDAIQRCLEQGRSAIVLVPEISLTPQTVERFESRFGPVAVLHSHLSDGERAEAWAELQQGQTQIAIGPRSALFAPLDNLGLIILDEEHETTFKQQNVPRYHARDVALMRAEATGAVVVLGSATPSLEAYESARRGHLTQLDMPSRVCDRPMPSVTLVDMRHEKPTGPGGIFSSPLVSLTRQALDRNEQVLFFLNRRGFNTSVMCKGCGNALECSDCSISLVYYRDKGHLLCHYCNHSRPLPRFCPDCRSPELSLSGYGTEFVEDATRRVFRGARIARMDSQTMARRHAHENIYRQLKEGRIDILIGTQMVAKGLDLPGITLIGVLAADRSLLIPDFRSAERTFQLLTQVSGRAGRGDRSGRVLAQTYSPEHYSLQCAAAHDFPRFAELELKHRHASSYPPFGVLTRVLIQGPDEDGVEASAARIAASLREPARLLGMRLLGPAPAPLRQVKKLFRHHLIIQSESSEKMIEFLHGASNDLKSRGSIKVLVDRDPTSMM